VAEFNWADLAAAAAEAGFGGPIPNGTYRLRVAKAEVTKTKDNTKQKIATQFKVVEGPHANATLFNDFVLSPENPKALGYFFRDMKTLGFGDDYFASNPPLARLASEMLNREVMGVVGTRIWNEQEKNELTRIRPVSGAASAPQLPHLPQAPQTPLMAPPAPPVAPPIDHAQPLVPPAVPVSTPAPAAPQYAEPEYSTPDYGDNAPPTMPAF